MKSTVSNYILSSYRVLTR